MKSANLQERIYLTQGVLPADVFVHRVILSALLFLCLVVVFFPNKIMAQKQANTGYLLMRVFDSNKYVASGNIYINSKIFIVYEDGKLETIELLPFSEKNEVENLKKIGNTLNEIKKKGYLLMSATTTGEQGALVTDYVFLKQF